MELSEGSAYCSLNFSTSGGNITWGAAVLRSLPGPLDITTNTDDNQKGTHQNEANNGVSSSSTKTLDSESIVGGVSNGFSIDVYEFLDNDQLSNLDSFLVQVGGCFLFVPDDLNTDDTTTSATSGSSKGLKKKFNNIIQNGRDIELKFVKKSSNYKKSEVSNHMSKIMRDEKTHVLNTCENERPLGYACIDCLVQKMNLLDNDDYYGKFVLQLGSLTKYMRLDSAAAEAVNLLPKPDHPNAFGSLFGVLNRCKTKMGSRLLERWLRQPLLDKDEINSRYDIVELLKNNTVIRNNLIDSPLKGTPDVDAAASKLQGKKAGLQEILRLYMLACSIPNFVTVLSELCRVRVNSGIVDHTDSNTDNDDNNNDDNVIDDDDDDTKRQKQLLRDRFLVPLESIVNKFELYKKLVEHVIDFRQLPDLMVNAEHDPVLKELAERRDNLKREAEGLKRNALDTWASGRSNTDLKLEKNVQHGLIFRSTRPNDITDFTARSKDVIVLSVLKNGAHLTTKSLQSIGSAIKELDGEYRVQQAEIVSKAVETAITYVGLAEATSAIISELDVLASFASVAALSPAEYTRPKLHPMAVNKKDRVLKFDQARHPCVELMDDISFIPNNYNCQPDINSFQIITGPNMGGKSTYIRGIGCLVVLAQIGSFVPCEYAELSIIDCILARVGAGDAVQKGVSTFMAEMLEASVILSTATSNSLIIIDELGRGTSTFDGFGIAWAISDYIVTHIQASCLFATHFHELTAMAEKHNGVCNRHVTAYVENERHQASDNGNNNDNNDNKNESKEGGLVMLYDVRDGPCLRSFGIHVAAMAGFPKDVISEAKRKINDIESTVGSHSSTSSGDDNSDSKKAKVDYDKTMTSFKDIDFTNVTDTEIKNQLVNLPGLQCC